MVETVTANVSVSISALPKSGKSHLMLTFPAPMVVYSFDIGLEPVLKKFGGKDIRVKTFPLPLLDSVKAVKQQKEIKLVWDSFLKEYIADTENREIATLSIDTGTALYRIATLARAAELNEDSLVQWQYGDVYARLDAMIYRARLAGKNFVMTHYMKEKYVGGITTGELEPACYANAISAVDVAMTLKRVVRPTTPDERKASKSVVDKKNVIIGTIQDSRFGIDTDGIEIEMPTYNDLVTLFGL